MNKNQRTAAIILGVVLIIFLIIGHAIGRVTKLDKAPALAGIIAQNLYAGSGKSQMPQAGTDFNLKDTYYVQDKQWAVVKIEPTDQNTERSLAVLQKQSDFYKVVLGPGTAFDQFSIRGLPPDVAAYLAQNGAIYEPAN